MDRNFEFRRTIRGEDRIALKLNGKEVGFADLEYYEDPFPVYYLDYLSVDTDQRGSGHGSQLLEQVNAFLDQQAKPGILVNTIESENPTQGMYERHGRKPVAGSTNWLGYKLD